MKTPEQKERIREMMRADAGEKNPVWDAFRRQLGNEAQAVSVPPLEIRHAPRSRLTTRWLAPVAAVLVLGVGLLVWRLAFSGSVNPPVAQNETVQPVPARQLGKGDVFISEKREILFFGGNATLRENQGRIEIAASELKAAFRLRQKTDMKIEHPLVSVAITGTEFIFDAARGHGVIELTEGSLAVTLKREAKSVTLRAPARLEFSETGHKLKAEKPSPGKILYRYDLANGESFFAHPVRHGKASHTVEVLGGKTEEIPLEDIVRFEPVEKP